MEYFDTEFTSRLLHPAMEISTAMQAIQMTLPGPMGPMAPDSEMMEDFQNLKDICVF